MWDHSPPTQYWTCSPYIGGRKSQPLDCQGSPWNYYYLFYLVNIDGADPEPDTILCILFTILNVIIHEQSAQVGMVIITPIWQMRKRRHRTEAGRVVKADRGRQETETLCQSPESPWGNSPTILHIFLSLTQSCVSSWHHLGPEHPSPGGPLERSNPFPQLWLLLCSQGPTPTPKPGSEQLPSKGCLCSPSVSSSARITSSEEQEHIVNLCSRIWGTLLGMGSLGQGRRRVLPGTPVSPCWVTTLSARDVLANLLLTPSPPI